MIPIVMVVLGGQVLGFLIGWASAFWFKRIPLDIEIGAVCPGLALLAIAAMFLFGLVNAIDYQRWLNKRADELRQARLLRGGP